ncbi:MAG: hypothetical protein WBP43_05090 [Chitinophagales bacterium]
MFTDIYGRVLMDKKINSYTINIPVADFKPGTYFLSVASGGYQRVY